MKTADEVKNITVLGAGTMGPGIAQNYAMSGCEVTMWTRSEATKERALNALRKGIETFIEQGIMPAGSEDEIFNRVHFAMTVPEAIEGADYIQESIVENADAKKELYEQLAEIVPPEVIIVSNTSALNIFEIVPEKLLPQMGIAHWYAPPTIMPLVELVKSDQAPDQLIDTTKEMLIRCHKRPVVMKKFIQGYIVNRLQQCIQGECFKLIDEGYCDAEAIDEACKTSFIPRAMVLGICKRIDFGGIDMTANNIKNHSYEFPKFDAMPECLQERLDKGELGVKTGKGFYDYTGKDVAEMMEHRDEQLFEAFALEEKFSKNPV
ncbi:MAG: 3-hydroxyacyl-CoA dehydrogenase family protein [Oscillospiraceae bacterium]|nr:3-hydroxyacyl-CoA dehydrogenase family protein [Oscillospiraceae bacterium]